MKQQQVSKDPLNQQSDIISIVAITWNLFGSLPPHNSLIQLLRSVNLQPLPDIICIGTQQCERSLCMSFCCESKNQWQNMIIEVFYEYQLSVTQTMNGLHLAILVKNNQRDYIEVEKRQKLRSGFCGIVGNKGAISISFKYLGQPFQFINCHLAAHQTESPHRNETINHVLSQLVCSQGRQIIFLGDFNYRIDISKQQYAELLTHHAKNTESEMNYSEWFKKDQLTNQNTLREQFLIHFEEGTIHFPPTYKLGVDTPEYNHSRIPGWTDRIFNRKSHKLHRTSYDCEYNIMGSDHRPVLARYERAVEETTFTVMSQNFVAVGGRSSCQLI